MDVALETRIYARCTCGKRLDDLSSYQDEEGVEITVKPCPVCMRAIQVSKKGKEVGNE